MTTPHGVHYILPALVTFLAMMPVVSGFRKSYVSHGSFTSVRSVIRVKVDYPTSRW